MIQIQLNEATAALRRIPVILVDATDGFSLETGITSPTIEVSENGAAQASGGGTFTEIGDGEYYYEFSSGEVSTIGFLLVRILGTGCREFKGAAQVVSYDPYAATNLGLTDITSIKGKTDTLTFDGSNVLADVMAMNAAVITNAAFAAGAIDANAIAAAAITSSEFAQSAADLVWSTAARALTDKAGFTISGTTQTFDALDTLLDSAHGAGSWATAVGFSTHTAAAVWAVGTRALTDKAGFTISGTKTTLDALNDILAADVWSVVTRQLSGTISDFDELDTALDSAHGAGSWLTGGAGGATIQVTPSIPKNIDLADTKTVRIALYLTDQNDDLPTTGEITPGTIKIDRSADGGTSWSIIRNDVACSEHAGAIYYDEVFSSGNGYASADMIRITFKGQIVTIAANNHEITDGTDGMVFITRMDSGLSGGGPSAGDIADAVWEEAIVDHSTSSTFGGKNQLVVPSETLADYKATGFSTHAAADIWTVGTRALTDKAGFTISGTTQTFDALDTLLDSAHGAGSWATAVGFSTHDAAAIWAVGTRALTDKAGFTISGSKTTLDALNDITAASIWAVGSRALTDKIDFALSAADKLLIADDVWDELLTGALHNIATSAGKRLRQLGEGVAGLVNDAGASTTVFVTNLTEIRDDFYNDQIVRFSSGNLLGHVRVISDYDGGTKTITTDEAMVEAPDDGIGFDVIPTHIHPKSEIGSVMWDELMSGHIAAGSFGEGIRRIIGLNGEFLVAEYDYTGDDNDVLELWQYDTLANFNTHNKSTGMIGSWIMNITYTSGKAQVAKSKRLT